MAVLSESVLELDPLDKVRDPSLLGLNGRIVGGFGVLVHPDRGFVLALAVVRSNQARLELAKASAAWSDQLLKRRFSRWRREGRERSRIRCVFADADVNAERASVASTGSTGRRLEAAFDFSAVTGRRVVLSVLGSEALGRNVEDQPRRAALDQLRLARSRRQGG